LRQLTTEKAPAAIGPYSQAIISGGFLFSAGQIPLDPVNGNIVDGDITRQAEQVMDNLEAVLASAGLTWADVVKTTVYLHDMADFPKVNELYASRLGSARPARSTVQVAALPRGAMIEMDVIAAVKS
jgi:2-iminobutanoate/2-iminopropanoate deaminase